MRAGELLCLVTDGVVEAQNRGGERYGSRRLHALLSRPQAGVITAQDQVDALCEDLRVFGASAELADDLTVLALRWIGPGAAGQRGTQDAP